MMGSNHTTRLFVLAGLALSSSAFGVTRNWVNAAGGFVSTPANWSPAALPVAADGLHFNIPGTYSVVFDAAVPTITSENFGQGTVSISATSPHTVTSQFASGISGSGTLNITSGSFTCNGVIGIGSSGSSTVNVSGPNTSLNGTSLTGLLRVGNGNAVTGGLNVTNGALVQTAGGVSIGAFGASSGAVTVSGNFGGSPSRLVTSHPVAGDVTLGTAGNGSMSVHSLGQVNCADDFVIGQNANFTGSLSVLVNSLVQVSGDMSIGATGSLIVSGVVAVSGTINHSGTITLTNNPNGDATIAASTFNAFNGSTTTAGGRLDAMVLGPVSTETAALTLNGSLDAGLYVPSGFVWQTALNIGAHPLIVRSVTPSRLGDVAISGGSITPIGTAGTLLAAGDSLIGFGTVNGPLEVNSSSTITATGTSTALTFNGLVTTSNPLLPVTLTGTTVIFGASGGFTGQGAISARVQSTGTITATGPLALGNGTSLGIISLGTLNTGLNHVTLSDSNGLSVGNATLAGGHLELVGTHPARTLNTTNGFLTGFGTVTCPLFHNHNSGQVSPGDVGASGIGSLHFSGNFASGDGLNPAGTINLDVHDNETFDMLFVSGTAVIAGTLNVTLEETYTPAPGERLTFFHAANVSGAFNTLNIPLGAVILYNTENIQILFPCPSDFNQDGIVDFFDYLDFADAFSSTDSAADFNGDTSIDFFDYLDFVDAFSLGC